MISAEIRLLDDHDSFRSRQLTYHSDALGSDDVGEHLAFFPSLRSIRFDAVSARDTAGRPILWTAVETCLTHPNISSVSFLNCRPPFLCMYGDVELTTSPSTLTNLSCVPYAWRQSSWPGNFKLHRLEEQSLQLLVPPMAPRAQFLDLPLETAPLEQMAGLQWPALRELRLSRSYLSRDKLYTLPNMLSDLSDRFPSLHHLSILAYPLAEQDRVPVLGPLSSQVRHPRLKSLILSYPDPDDAICSIQAPNLTHLSLRDSPRHYYSLHFPDVMNGEVTSAILSSSECLSILRRMNASTQLEKIELVYQADDAEDDLLRHITSAYPKLWWIELHRYRTGEDMAVPYVSRGFASSGLMIDAH